MAAFLSEVVAWRTERAKHFATDEPGVVGSHIFSGPVHFAHPDGHWEDLDQLVQSTAGGWAATTAEVRFGVESGYLTISRGAASIQMRPTMIGMVDRSAPATRWRKLADASYATVTRDGNTITVHDIFPNTDLDVTLTSTQMRKEFTVRQRPTLPDPTGLGWDPATTFLVIVWDIQKPALATMRDTVTSEVVASGYVGNNDLVVEDQNGAPVVYFSKGVGTSAIGRENPVWYVSLGAMVPFGEAFAYAKTMTATYPVVLDPTTSIATTAGLDGYTYTDTIYGAGLTSAGTVAYVGSTSYDAGKDGTGWQTMRAQYKFDLSGLSGTASAATFNFYVAYHTGSANPVRIDQVATTGSGTFLLATHTDSPIATPATSTSLANGWNSYAVAAPGLGGSVQYRIKRVTDGDDNQRFEIATTESGTAPYLSLTWAPGYDFKTSGMTHVFWKPEGSASGDRLVVAVASTSLSTFTMAAGWTAVGSASTAPSVICMIYYRDLGAGEPDSWSASTSTTRYATWRLWKFASGSFDSGVAPQMADRSNNQVGFYPDPPAITPAWGDSAPSWLIAAAVIGALEAPITAPDGYSSDPPQEHAAHTFWSATKTATVASDDPSTYECEVSITWATATVAVKNIVTVSIGEATTITFIGAPC